MHPCALALLLVAVTAPALAAPSLDVPALDAAEDDVPKASPRYIQSAPIVQDNEDNSLKQVYYEAASSTDVQLNQGVTQSEQAGLEVAGQPQQAPAAISFGGIMSSVWELVVSWVRGMLGLQRHDPPRMARAILGAAAGDEQCWKTTACQAGRLLRGLHEKEFIFMMMERLSPQQWKGVVKGMRRSAIDHEDCRVYECDA